jgi:tetratricopeptide (TPR) repeat protein
VNYLLCLTVFYDKLTFGVNSFSKVFIVKKILLSVLCVTFLAGCSALRFLGKDKAGTKAPDPRAVDLFVDGVVFELNQNIPGALLSYQEALLFDSTSSPIYTALGRDYWLMGKNESAVRMLSRAVALDPKNIEALELLSQSHLRNGEWDQAETILHRILEVEPGRVDVLHDLAVIYAETNHPEKSNALFEDIRRTGPIPDARLAFTLGELYAKLDQPQKAGYFFRRGIEADPNSGYGYWGLGASFEALGDTTAAEEQYLKAHSREPNLPQAKESLSNLYVFRKDWDKAVALWREAVDRDSTDLVARLELADVFEAKGDTAAAIAFLDETNKRMPDQWQGPFNLGRMYLDGDHWDKARECFQRVIALDRESQRGWLFLGITYASMDSLDQAVPCMDTAIRIAPQEPLSYLYLGTTLDRLKRPLEAVPPLEKAIELRPGWTAPINALASIYEGMKRYELSDSLFERGIKIAPDDSQLLNNYGYSLSERGIRLDEAMRMAQKALVKDPDNGAYLDTAGWIYYRLGDFQKALEYILKAAATHPANAVVIEHLGDVYDKLGDKVKAAEAWERAVKIDPNSASLLEKLNRK